MFDNIPVWLTLHLGFLRPDILRIEDSAPMAEIRDGS